MIGLHRVRTAVAALTFEVIALKRSMVYYFLDFHATFIPK